MGWCFVSTNMASSSSLRHCSISFHFPGIRKKEEVNRKTQTYEIMIDQAPAGHSHFIAGSHSLGSRCAEYVHHAPLACPAPFHLGAFVIAAPLPRKLFYWSVGTAGSFSPFQSLPSGHVLWEVCFWHPHPQTPFPSISFCNGSLFILFITHITQYICLYAAVGISKWRRFPVSLVSAGGEEACQGPQSSFPT